MQNAIATTVLLMATLFVVGCDSSLPETATVVGKVTYDGQPVTRGTVTFYPTAGRASLGHIQSDGSYVLTTFAKGDGALFGQHVVTIEAHRFATAGKPPSNLEEELTRGRPRITKSEWLVPERYSRRETSGLTAEVKPSGVEINFNLQAE